MTGAPFEQVFAAAAAGDPVAQEAMADLFVREDLPTRDISRFIAAMFLRMAARQTGSLAVRNKLASALIDTATFYLVSGRRAECEADLAEAAAILNQLGELGDGYSDDVLEQLMAATRELGLPDVRRLAVGMLKKAERRG